MFVAGLVFGWGASFLSMGAGVLAYKIMLHLRQPDEPEDPEPPLPQPICGCSHHKSFHYSGRSNCHFSLCHCQTYVGPEPLLEVVLDIPND